MALKYSIISFLFLIFILIQTSFLPYFNIMGAYPNLVFTLFFIIAFFDYSNGNQEGFFSAIAAGFLLDIFLPYYFGASIILLFTIYLFIKTINYFFKRANNGYPALYFASLFSVSFLLYYLVITIFLPFSSYHKLFFGPVILVDLIYNLIFAVAGFYIYKKFVNSAGDENQLKLL